MLAKLWRACDNLRGRYDKLLKVLEEKRFERGHAETVNSERNKAIFDIRDTPACVETPAQ